MIRGKAALLKCIIRIGLTAQFHKAVGSGSFAITGASTEITPLRSFKKVQDSRLVTIAT